MLVTMVAEKIGTHEALSIWDFSAPEGRGRVAEFRYEEERERVTVPRLESGREKPWDICQCIIV